MASYTWDDINNHWLAGGLVALEPDAVVAAFARVERHFGREWIEASRTDANGGIRRGSNPTLHIVTLGRLLESLDEAANTEHLLDKIRRGLPGAVAELEAIHLVCSGLSLVEIELEPAVVVGPTTRNPDFRVRRTGEDWVYVEVTQPQTSEAKAAVRRRLERLTGVIQDCEGSFALEVFLIREPTDSEVDAIASEILDGHRDADTRTVELPSGVGTLHWNTGPPGAVTLEDHGQPYTPRLWMSRTIFGGNVQRHIVVRWPFTDERAEDFLRSEARQLPSDAPGLIMIQTSAATGAMTAWRALIKRRLQPSQHTRVSAVCLFASSIWPTEAGEVWRPQTQFIANPHARLPLPAWISQQLERFRSDEVDGNA